MTLVQAQHSSSHSSHFTTYAHNVLNLRYAHVVQGRKETWSDICKRVCDAVLKVVKLPKDVCDAVFEAMVQRKFVPGGRILSQAGREYHQTDNCFTLRAEDTREGWANLAQKCTMMFMSGGGVGVDYSDIRSSGKVLKRSGGISSGPVPLIQMIDAVAHCAIQGGDRRGANYASLVWDHLDIAAFIAMKKQSGALPHTNISVRFDTAWQQAYQGRLQEQNFNFKNTVFYDTLKHACQYGDPGFQFDNDMQVLRNACTEIISEDDCDSCCLGSLNFAAIDNVTELAHVTQLAVLFLLCNTLYTDMPTSRVRYVKGKNRRIGLGLMGVAEWFIQRQMQYGMTLPLNHPKVLAPENIISCWLQVYKEESQLAAVRYATTLNINTPIATRAIAPTGTISIAAGFTTPGIEPVFHTAYKRTYNTPQGLQSTNVIDPVVQKWIDMGYNVRDIDTAWTLSQTTDGIERRLAFQAFVQQYVDNAISSTVNLPPYVEGVEEQIAPLLLKYLPQLRGVTFYPDGRYDNQPVVPLDIKDVLGYSNSVIQEAESCKGGICGT